MGDFGYSGANPTAHGGIAVPHTTDARFSGRHPFQIFILFLILLISVPILFGVAARPGSITTILPPPAGLVWSIVLAAGSGAALHGVYWRDRGKGLIVEQFGLGLVGLASAVYGTAILLVGPAGSAVATALTIGLAGACFWRYWQIQRLLNHVKLEAEACVAIKKALGHDG
jgi:hypothetical protein